MSSLVYGSLTARREEAPATPRGQSALPDVKSYVDTVTALIPAEVLAFHALAVELTTETVKSEGTGKVLPGAARAINIQNNETATVVTDPGILRVVFIALMVAAPLLYVLVSRPRFTGHFCGERGDHATSA